MALLLPFVRAQVGSCDCDVARPESMQSRECGLCRAAEEQPAGVAYFALHDANPTKPNRWLALPRYHGHNPQELSGMTAAQRTASTGPSPSPRRTSCGARNGAWLSTAWKTGPSATCTSTSASSARGSEDDHFAIVDGAADIPLPRKGEGIWVHLVAGKLHVHWGDPSPELLLER